MSLLRSTPLMPKLIGGFVLVAILAATVGAAGLIGLNTLNNNVSTISTVHLRNITDLLRTRSYLADAVRDTRAAVIVPSTSQGRIDATTATTARDQARSDLQTYRSLHGLNGADRSLAAAVDPLFTQWFRLDAEVGAFGADNTAASNAEASRVSLGPEEQLARPIIADLDRLIARNEKAVTSVEASSSHAFSTARAELLAVIALAVLLASALGYALCRAVAAEQRLHDQTAAERDRVRQILDVLPEGIMIYDADTRVMSMNQAAEALVGTNLVGKRRDEFDLMPRRLDGTPVSREDQAIGRAVEVGDTSSAVQILMRNIATGCDVPVLADSAPLRDVTGTTTGTVSVFQDISDIEACRAPAGPHAGNGDT